MNRNLCTACDAPLPGHKDWCPLRGVRKEETAHDRVLRFLNDLCHPEQYGHAVTKEVRQRARELANEMEELGK